MSGKLFQVLITRLEKKYLVASIFSNSAFSDLTDLKQSVPRPGRQAACKNAARNYD